MVPSAEERAWGRLWSAAVDAETIPVKHLRPALTKTMAMVAGLAPKLAAST